MKRPGASLVLSAALAIPLAAQAPGGRLVLQPCRLPGVTDAARCGRYEVWENRETRAGRRISLSIAEFPALDSLPEPDPIVILEGGPGQSNVASAARFAESPLRRRRAILLVDARGTGDSGPLECRFGLSGAAGVRNEFLPLDGVRECREDLSRTADLAQYHSLTVADDLDEVLAALAISRVNLWGFSGGTRQALVFLRRHPAAVRSALLEGPVPLDARTPLSFAADAQAALEGLMQDCRGDSLCASRFPSFSQEFRAALDRLRRAPAGLRVPWGGPRSADSVTVTASAFAQVIRYMLYQPDAARALPLAVHYAAQGDFHLLADRIRTLGIPGGIAMGFWLSSTCSEDVPWFGLREAEAAAAGTFLGTYRVRQQKAACALWPRGRLPAGYLAPVRAQTPVLILVGERDPVTPARWGREIVRTLPQGRVVVVPGGGHSFAKLDGQNCLAQIRDRFVGAASTAELELACLATVRRPPFLLESLIR